MGVASKRNFNSAKYGKFIWPQKKRNWFIRRATKKKERCADPCCDWTTFGARCKCSFKLWMAQQCVASSWPYNELSLHSFFLGFPKLHIEVWFFFSFLKFCLGVDDFPWPLQPWLVWTPCLMHRCVISTMFGSCFSFFLKLLSFLFFIFMCFLFYYYYFV